MLVASQELTIDYEFWISCISCYTEEEAIDRNSRFQQELLFILLSSIHFKYWFCISTNI